MHVLNHQVENDVYRNTDHWQFSVTNDWCLRGTLFWLLVWYKFRKEQEVQNVESICTISPVFLSAFGQQWTHTHRVCDGIALPRGKRQYNYSGTGGQGKHLRRHPHKIISDSLIREKEPQPGIVKAATWSQKAVGWTWWDDADWVQLAGAFPCPISRWRNEMKSYLELGT